jgi:hypothetical protein
MEYILVMTVRIYNTSPMSLVPIDSGFWRWCIIFIIVIIIIIIIIYVYRFSASFSVFYTYVHLEELLWRGISPSQSLSLYKEQHKQNKCTQTSMPVVGFDPTTPEFAWKKTVDALESAAIVFIHSGFRLQCCMHLSHAWYMFCPSPYINTVIMIFGVQNELPLLSFVPKSLVALCCKSEELKFDLQLVHDIFSIYFFLPALL